MSELDQRLRKYLERRINRRQVIKAGTLAALGLAFSKPFINTISAKPAFASGYVVPGTTTTTSTFIP